MNVLLIDDHALFRAGLRLLLIALDGQIQVTESSRAGEALQALRARSDMQLCLLDLDLRTSSGVNLLDQLRALAPAMPVVVVSALDDRPTIRRCIECGAMSFIPKSAPPDVLLAALQRVLAGEVFLPRGIDLPSTEPLQVALSPRQRDVLARLARGMPAKSIARDLGLSEHTVKEYTAALFLTLGVHNRTEAVIKASQLALRPSAAAE